MVYKFGTFDLQRTEVQSGWVPMLKSWRETGTVFGECSALGQERKHSGSLFLDTVSSAIIIIYPWYVLTRHLEVVHCSL